jgi:hypothetical protein
MLLTSRATGGKYCWASCWWWHHVFLQEEHIMGFRFRRSIKLLPGVRINLSKSGVSTSVGVPGATINFSDKGTRTTVGIPGSGMSYSERVSGNQAGQEPGEPDQQSSGNWLLWVIAAIFVVGALYGLLR